MHIRWLLLGSCLLLQAPAFAQERVPPPQDEEAAEASDDIVVTGLRDLDDPESAVTRRTLGSSKTGPGANKSRSVFAFAQRFASCAVRRGSPDMMRRLRRALDGRINGSGQRLAQSRLILAKAACTQDPSIALGGGGASISDLYDTSYYDRGALFIAAIETFAPDLKLTKKQTADPAVQRRFDAREVPLAQFRLPVDRQYFETAVCLVRLQPELAVRLVKTDGPPRVIDTLEAAIVNGAKICVSNARRVYFDPTQFRFYIADAVYRWAVAAKGLDTLIPES